MKDIKTRTLVKIVLACFALYLAMYYWTPVAGFLGVALSAFVIYGLNYNFCFRRAELTDAQRRRVSLALALFTAPWLFLLPAKWLY